MTDDKIGAGWPVTLIEPSLIAHSLTGFSSDVALTIDPNTGVFVSQRRAHVSLPTRPLLEATEDKWPVGVSNSAVRPWLVRVDDIHGKTVLFKVVRSYPDQAIGVVILELEVYTDELPPELQTS